jgi:hypothetical protein
MKKNLLGLFVFGLLCLSATAMAQVTWNVPGNAATINEAISRAASGDIINLVGEVPYTENVVVNQSVTIKGAGIATLIRPSSGIGITVTADNVILQDFEVADATDHGIWADNVRNLTITRVTADNNGTGLNRSGIALRRVTGTTVLTNVTATGNYAHGLEIGNGCTNVQVNGGTFTNNGTAGNTSYGGGIMIYADAAQTTQGTSIYGNVTASVNTTAGIYLFCYPGGHIINTTIGATGTINLDNNGSGGGSYGTGGAAVLLYGPCDQTTITANSTNNGVTVVPTAGLVVLGTDNLGSNSPTNTVAKNCNLTGFTSTSPAATMKAKHGTDSLICTNDVNAIHGNDINNWGEDVAGYDVEDVLIHKVDDVKLGRFLGPGSTVYVTPNSGSIQRGIIAARPPFSVATDPYTAIQVKAGTYNESATLNLSWTAATLSGDGASTIIQSSSDLGINISASTVTVCSLKVTGASKHGIWANGVSGLNIHDVTVDGNGTAAGASTVGSGIAVRGITGTSTITNVTATNNKNDGLEIGDGCNGLKVSGGTYSNNGVAGFTNTGGGIFIYSNGTSNVIGTIIGGTLTASDNTTAGIYIFSTPGVVTGTAIGQTSGDAITLTNNGSTDGGGHSGGAGLLVYGAANATTITANFTHGNFDAGIVNIGLDGTGSASPPIGTAVSNSIFTGYTCDYPAVTLYVPSVGSNGPFLSNNDVTATNNIFKYRVKVKVILQGPSNTSGIMTTTLATNNVIPLTQPYGTTPYNIAQFNYTGPENVANVSVFSTNLITDWILVELRSTYNGTAMARRAALLKRDGTVLDIDLIDGVLFSETIANGYAIADKYIVVRHRNHLAVMSASAVIVPNCTAYDFTTSLSQAYGVSVPMKDVSGVGTKFAMWCGDVNGNGTITYSGGSNDRAIILTAVGSAFGGSSAMGYYREDLTMNGICSYSGGSNDRSLILSSIGGSFGGSKATNVP